MNKSLLFATSWCLIAGCKASTSPPLLGGSAVMPRNGSTFTYNYSGIEPTAQLTEHVTIKNVSDSVFCADLLSDTINDFFTSSQDSIIILRNGNLKDLLYCACDSTELPIGTQSGYEAGPDTLPRKENGQLNIAITHHHSAYVGEETVAIAGESFECSKVSHIDYVELLHNDPAGDTAYRLTQVYWYSRKLGYFVKEELLRWNYLSPETTIYSRTLTGYRLGP